MGPLSIIASAIAIIQLTTDLTMRTRKYYESVKNTAKKIADLVDELTSLEVVLEHLKSTSQRAKALRASHTIATGKSELSRKANRLPVLQRMMNTNGLLAICYDEMPLFMAKLTKDPSKVKRSLKWPFERDEIKPVVNRLRGLK